MRWIVLILCFISFPAFAMHFNLKSQIDDVGPRFWSDNFLVGDTDRDSNPEVFVRKTDNYSTYHLAIYEFENDSWQLAFMGDSIPFFFPLTLGCLDGDSLYDLWVQKYDTLCMFESPDPNSFPTQRVWTSPFGPIHSQHWRVNFADMDNDGKTDIVDFGEGPFSRNNLCIYEHNGDNSFDIVFHDTTWPVWLGSQPILGDFDGDGKMEIAATGISYVYFIENTGDNTYSMTFEATFDSLTGGVCCGNCIDIFLGPDLDGDGKLEILLHASPFSHRRGQWREDLIILESDGDNSYSLSWYDSLPGYTEYNVFPGHNRLSSTVADIDGDSIPEILLSAAHKVYILKVVSNDNYELVGEIYLTPIVGAPLDEAMDNLQIKTWDIDQNGLNDIILGLSYYYNDQEPPRLKTLVFEKGIDLQWIYPTSTDTFFHDSTLTLKWKILDNIAVDSCFIFLTSAYNPLNRQLIFSGSHSDTSFTWSPPDSLGWFKLLLLATGPGSPQRRDSSFSSLFFIYTNTDENPNLPIIPHNLSIKPSNPAQLPLSISFYLDRPHNSRLYVVDVSGKVVKEFNNLKKGYNEVVWHGDMGGGVVSSGVYFIVLEDGIKRHTRRTLLLK